MVDNQIVKRGFVAILVATVFVLAFLVLKPIIIPIVFGLLFAYMFDPIYKSINKKLKRRNLSAFLLIFGIILILAIPIVYFAPNLVNQTFETYTVIQKVNFAEHLTNILPSLFDADVATAVAANLNNIFGKIFTSFLNQFTALFVNLPNILLQFAVFLFTFFFAIRDSAELKEYVSNLSPFSKATEAKFLKEFRGITNSIVFGQVLIGILQGLALGIGLFILGIPKALVLTVIAMIVSIIPVLGSWLVWLPLGLILLVTGSTFSGIFIMLYGAIFVSTIDNLLRPYLLARSSNLPVALGVIGTIGGLYLFGIAGLVLGPLILAYGLILIDFYKQGKLNELFKK
ncbi:AI-2E family transporter [archaeon]|jgi:predicted PurR-regulated permease PerM|nr:AI-2E family transporter [archaeon]MBT3578242.1 AI-2E family transporter [archaeon]MBT6819837.1 AI-2E family transporter [archaeon]MBT6956587.1 AI-2E family transporter [archaeon]MBT7025619.1 AI-2E family transporter [archaeon]